MAPHFKMTEVKIQTRELYLRLDVVLTDNPPKDYKRPISALVLRPAWFGRLWTNPAFWLQEGVKLDLTLGSAALKDAAGFQKASDFLAFLMLGARGHSGLISISSPFNSAGGRLVKREVTETAEEFHWTGEFAYSYTSGSTTGGLVTVNEKIRLRLSANKRTGRLEIAAEPVGSSLLFPKATRLTPPPLPAVQAAWYANAEAQAWKGQAFYPEFPPLARLPASNNCFGPFFERLTLPFQGAHWDELLIVNNELEARAAVEKHMAAQRNAPVGSPEARTYRFQPEKITRCEETALYYALEVDGMYAGEKRSSPYLIPRPACLEKAAGSPNSWIPPGFLTWLSMPELERMKAFPPKAVAAIGQRAPNAAFLGKAARGDPQLFAEAMDLLAYLIFCQDYGFILSREADFRGLRWTAMSAELPRDIMHARVPSSRDDWRFGKVTLSVDRETGKVSAEKAPGPQPAEPLAKQGQARMPERPMPDRPVGGDQKPEQARKDWWPAGAALTVMISFFDRETSGEQAKAALGAAKLDLKDWRPGRQDWSGPHLALFYRGELARADALRLAGAINNALVKGKAECILIPYSPGVISVGLPAGTTQVQAKQILLAAGLPVKELDFLDLEEQGLNVSVRGVPRGQEWDFIDRLRARVEIRHAQLSFYAMALGL